MGIPVMIMGESGSGKSRSMKNFKKGELSVFNVSKKLLPFKADFAVMNTDNYEQIKTYMTKSVSPAIAVDDATYLMTSEFMRTAKVNGYQKYLDMALNFYNLIQFVVNELPPEKIVYFLGHIEYDPSSGKEKFKTIGKMLDEKITLEGLFTIVLKTSVQDKRYCFQTHTNGSDTVKSPEGMFEDLIPNDLKLVDDAIRNFYGFAPNNTNTNK